MSALDLQTRLKSLSENLRTTSQSISRLSKLSSSASSPPQLNPAQIRLELSTEIHQSFKELEEDYELLKQEAEDFTVTSSWSSGARRSTSEKDAERAHIATQVERLAEDLKLYFWTFLFLSLGSYLLPLKSCFSDYSAARDLSFGKHNSPLRERKTQQEVKNGKSYLRVRRKAQRHARHTSVEAAQREKNPSRKTSYF